MNPGERLRRLVFQWPGRSVSLAFPLIFVGVVVVHALTFYGFQVVYPPVSSVSPPPGEVMLISPENPAHQALLEWVDAQSPALAPRLQEQTPEGLGRVRYEPSYIAVQSLPKPAAAPRREMVYPKAYGASDLLIQRRTAPELTGEAVRTSLRISGGLEARTAGEGGQSLSFTHRAEGGLLPSVFLLGVNAHGRVLYTFLQESSGSEAMDADAERALRRQVFAPGKLAVEWGRATFAWGEDAMATSVPVSEEGGGE